MVFGTVAGFMFFLLINKQAFPCLVHECGPPVLPHLAPLHSLPGPESLQFLPPALLKTYPPVFLCSSVEVADNTFKHYSLEKIYFESGILVVVVQGQLFPGW